MSFGIVDSTVVIHILRGQKVAQNWATNYPTQLSIVSTSWMEVMSGTMSKANQAATRKVLDNFETLYLTLTDQQWAMQQVEVYQFSHRIGIYDCQIASVAHRLQIPLYTHNLKHMRPLLGALAVKPY
ncbi:MAG: PIN domain-containing protein [Chloroflexota bacterium]